MVSKALQIRKKVNEQVKFQANKKQVKLQEDMDALARDFKSKEKNISIAIDATKHIKRETKWKCKNVTY